MSEPAGELAGLVDQERRQPLDAVGVRRLVGPGDRERRHDLAAGAEDGRGERGQAELELVDRRRVAARAYDGELAAEPPARRSSAA